MTERERVVDCLIERTVISIMLSIFKVASMFLYLLMFNDNVHPTSRCVVCSTSTRTRCTQSPRPRHTRTYKARHSRSKTWGYDVLGLGHRRHSVFSPSRPIDQHKPFCAPSSMPREAEGRGARARRRIVATSTVCSSRMGPALHAHDHTTSEKSHSSKCGSIGSPAPHGRDRWGSSRSSSCRTQRRGTGAHKARRDATSVPPSTRRMRRHSRLPRAPLRQAAAAAARRAAAAAAAAVAAAAAAAAAALVLALALGGYICNCRQSGS
jgi:hypothetical protein